MHYLLHIDTSSDSGVVAISGDGILIAHRTNNESRNHASTINIMVDSLLADAQILAADISAVVVCGGPGSYTGLRIGLATAKGLCYALDKPLLLENRLTLLAWQAFCMYQHQFEHFAALLVARDKEYFIGIYDNGFNCIVDPQHIMEDQLPAMIAAAQKVCFIGNAAPDIIPQLKINDCKIIPDTEIDLKYWCLYAFEKYKCNNIVNLSTSEPFYLKQVYTHK